MRNATATAIATALLLSACQAQKTYTGSAPGTNSGVLVNSEVAAGGGEPPVGAIEGIFLGADIGRSLQEGDRALAARAEYDALEYARAGLATEWNNPDSSNSGRVVAGGTIQINKLDCREYTHTVSVDGRTRVARAVACRQPGGTWRVVDK